METNIIYLSIILLSGIILFISDRFRPELISIGMMIALLLTGVLKPEEAFKGFASEATITIASMFILSYALSKTGALAQFGLQLGKVIRKSPMLGFTSLLAIAALLSAFLNNTPIVAVLIPVVLQATIAAKQNPKSFLIPLSYATILGGTCTLLGTSTNILASSVLKTLGKAPLQMFDLAPMGLILTLIGLVYLIIFGRKLLPCDEVDEVDLQKKFSMSEYITEFTLTDDSVSQNLPIMDSPLVTELDMEIIEVIRGEQRFLLPPKDMILKAGDQLKVRANAQKFKELRDRLSLLDETPILFGGEGFQTSGTSLLELLVPTGSSFVGNTLKQLEFKRHYRGVPLAIRQSEEIVHDKIEATPLRAGDVLLVEMKTVRLDEFKNQSGSLEIPFVILNEDITPEFKPKELAIILAVFAFIMISSVLQFIDISTAALTGALTLTALKVIDVEDIYKSIQWNVLFLIGSILSLAVALSKTGLDKLIGNQLVEILLPLGPHGVLAGLFVATTVLTEVLSNNASAVLMIPIAITIGEQLGLDIMPFIITVTLAASMSFITPIGYQTNTMVYVAGAYKFKDFFKVGFLLSLILGTSATLLIPYFFPF